MGVCWASAAELKESQTDGETSGGSQKWVEEREVGRSGMMRRLHPRDTPTKPADDENVHLKVLFSEKANKLVVGRGKQAVEQGHLLSPKWLTEQLVWAPPTSR